MTPQQLRSIANNFHYQHKTLEYDINRILEECKSAAAQGFYAHLVTLKVGEKEFKKTEIDYIVRRLQDRGLTLEACYDQHKEEVDLQIEW